MHFWVVTLAFVLLLFFFFNDTATTEIYTLSLHDALPIWASFWKTPRTACAGSGSNKAGDRKSTRLNSSHLVISYAVFCLKKQKKRKTRNHAALVGAKHADVSTARVNN